MTTLRVLYADDDPDIRTVVSMALLLDPDVVLTLADSGEAALAVATTGTAPDVAVLDVMMPGMNGPALMERLRRNPRTAHVPVIFMTAKAREADIAFYREQGAIGVILKPFDPLHLAGRIRALIEGEKTSAD